MRRATSAILAALGCLALYGCGGSASTTLGIDTNPRIRLVNAIASPATSSILVDTTTVQSNSNFGFATDYQIFKNGNHEIKFLDGTTQASLVDSTELLELNHYYTAIAYQTSATTWGLLFLSDKPSPVITNGQIRVVNATNSAVDVYVTAPGADISASTPTISNEAGGDATQGYTIADLGGNTSGTFQVRITQPGTKTVINSTTVTLNQSEVATLVVTSNGGAQQLLVLPAKKF